MKKVLKILVLIFIAPIVFFMSCLVVYGLLHLFIYVMNFFGF